jgi:hypothetical protein
VRSLRSNTEANQKRKHPRVGLRAKTQITRGAESVTVWVRDVSSGGVNICCSFLMESGSGFELILSPTETVSCMVRHCRKAGPSLFIVGAKFLGEISSFQGAPRGTSKD